MHAAISREPRRSHGEGAREGSRDESVSLWLRLLASHNLMLAELRKRLATKCSLARFDLLANLDREDGQTLASLSRRMLVTAGNLTGLVTRAERDGVVQRRPDPADKRLSRVWLTKKGQKLVRELVPVHAEHVAELTRGLDADSRRALRSLLGRLKDSLSTLPKDATP